MHCSSGLQVGSTCPTENWPLPTSTYPHIQKWVQWLASSRQSKPPELFLKFTIRYKRCLSVSHSKSVFMYCIYSMVKTCSIATYVLNFFDIIYVTGRSFRTPFCDKGIKGRMNSHFCRYMFPAIFVENYCFNC